MINLLEKRIANAEKTFENNLSNDCYSNGTADGSKQVGGLQYLVVANPTTGTVGGINRATWGFWQNQAWSAATAGLTLGTATVQTMFNRQWLSQARGADKPDLIIADNTMYRYYWESLQAIQRITSTKDAEAGYQSLKFMTADVVYDGGFEGLTGQNQGTNNNQAPPFGTGYTWSSGSGAPATTAYFLNTDYIFFRPHKTRNMVPLDPDRFSVNQDAMVKLIGWAGNLTMSNAFLQGVLGA